MRSVLFVCLGNICRSPTAEGVFRARSQMAGLHISCDSAGTGAWHIGNPPDHRAQAKAKANGLDLSDLRARQFQSEDFNRFDLIVAMDRENQRDMERLRPKGSQTAVRLFMEFAPAAGIRDLPDPYYDYGFDGVFDLIVAASDGLIAQLSLGAQTSSAVAPQIL